MTKHTCVFVGNAFLSPVSGICVYFLRAFSLSLVSVSGTGPAQLHRWHEEGQQGQEGRFISMGDQKPRSSLGHKGGHADCWSFKNTPLDQLLHEMNSKNNNNKKKKTKALVNVKTPPPRCPSHSFQMSFSEQVRNKVRSQTHKKRADTGQSPAQNYPETCPNYLYNRVKICLIIQIRIWASWVFLFACRK